MIQCTAVTLLPPPDYIAEQATPERPAHEAHVWCELGEDHTDDHAQFLFDENIKDGGVWALWNAEGRTKLVILPWCTVLHPDSEDACSFFAGHSSEHGWDVVDPTRKALEAALAIDYPHLFPADEDGPNSD